MDCDTGGSAVSDVELLAERAGVTLFDYQLLFLDAVPDMPDNARACLYYKTGAGKSLTALMAVALKGHDRCVVVAPPSTHPQWTELGVRLGVFVEPMSHARFRFKDTRLSRTVPVIADEFHLFGGQKGKGWKKLDRLAMHLQAPLLLLSATPNYNDAERCYCVQHILDPNSVKGGFLQFLYENCLTEQNPFSMTPNVLGFKDFSDASEYLANLPDVFYLPDDAEFHIETVHYMASMPQELLDYGYNSRDHRMVASTMELRHTVRFQGLVNSQGLLQPHVRDLVLSLLEEGTLIFAAHATVAEAMSRTLDENKVYHELVTGKMSKDEKAGIIDDMRKGQFPVLIGTATLATGTDGLDRVCDTLIILDDTDDDALRRQLIGRILPRGDYVYPKEKKIFRLSPIS